MTPPERKWLKRLLRPAWLGTLRRVEPLSHAWGYDRGTPVDRYYVERFLGEHRHQIRGRVLEVKDDGYSRRFGMNVRQVDVLDIDPSNRRATIVADLAAADAVPSSAFDCFVLTQTLQFVYETRAAVAHARRILRPGGTLLATVPAVSRLARGHPDYWRFTPAACMSLFAEAFGADHVSVHSYGNVLTAIAFLAGMALEELSQRELQAHDERFPVIVAVCATKPGS